MSKKGTSTPKGLFVLIFLSGVGFSLCFGLLFHISKSIRTLQNSSSSMDLAEDEKRFAVLLSEKQLYLPAIESYEHYLKQVPLSSTQQSNIYYQIGDLYDRAHQWERATAAYYKSQILDPEAEFANLRDRKIIACFEKLGRFQEAEYALSSATALQKETKTHPGAIPIAKIQNETLYLRDIDAIITLFPKEEQQRLQEPTQKKEFARQYVANQILLRKAKKLNLQEDSHVRLRLKWLSEELLLQALFEKEKEKELRLDPLDIENYYKTNLSLFAEPAQAKISHIQLDTKSDAEGLLLQIQSGSLSFADAAKQHSKDLLTREQGGSLSSWITNLPTQKITFLQAEAPELLQAIFQATEEQLLSTPIPSPKGYHLIYVHEIKPTRQRAFEEVKEQVRLQYQQEKIKGLQQKLFQESFQSTEVEFYEKAFEQTSTPASSQEKEEQKK